MKKRHSEEQITRILRESETNQIPVREVCRQHNITEQTLYRWPNKYGGMGASAQGLGIRERPAQALGGRTDAGHRRAEGVQPKKMTTPSGRRRALEHLTRRGISQRKACRYLGLSRRVTSYLLKQPEKDQAMGDRLIAASQDVPRFGYRRMAAWLSLSESRVRRMWYTLGLNIPRNPTSAVRLNE